MMMDLNDAARAMEDPQNGLFLGNAPLHFVVEGDRIKVLVDARTFMEVQRQRNQFRKTLSLINAWQIDPEATQAGLAELLTGAGFTLDDARMALAILGETRSGGLPA